MAGRLRHRLEIQEATETRATDGQPIKAWTAVKTVWGSIEPMKGLELQQAQQLCARVTHKIVIRGRQPLSGHRVLFKDRFLNVEYAMDQQERGITTIAYATEVPA